jgi:hypothetical protein
MCPDQSFVVGEGAQWLFCTSSSFYSSEYPLIYRTSTAWTTDASQQGKDSDPLSTSEHEELCILQVAYSSMFPLYE